MILAFLRRAVGHLHDAKVFSGPTCGESPYVDQLSGSLEQKGIHMSH